MDVSNVRTQEVNMPELDYAAMGKEALRKEMRDRELSYSKMNNAQMRDALRANDAEMGDMVQGENDFEMSQAELDAQTARKPAAQLTADDEQQIAAEAASRKPAAPRTRKGVTIEKDREERNGVKRPSKGGVCREVWDYLDLFQEMGPTLPTAKDVKAEAPKHKWNPNNAMIEFYQWRKFNGISGRAK
jgi:hypothetical protein